MTISSRRINKIIARRSLTSEIIRDRHLHHLRNRLDGIPHAFPLRTNITDLPEQSFLPDPFPAVTHIPSDIPSTITLDINNTPTTTKSVQFSSATTYTISTIQREHNHLEQVIPPVLSTPYRKKAPNHYWRNVRHDLNSYKDLTQEATDTHSFLVDILPPSEDTSGFNDATIFTQPTTLTTLPPVPVRHWDWPDSEEETTDTTVKSENSSANSTTSSQANRPDIYLPGPRVPCMPATIATTSVFGIDSQRLLHLQTGHYRAQFTHCNTDALQFHLQPNHTYLFTNVHVTLRPDGTTLEILAVAPTHPDQGTTGQNVPNVTPSTTSSRPAAISLHPASSDTAEQGTSTTSEITTHHRNYGTESTDSSTSTPSYYGPRPGTTARDAIDLTSDTEYDESDFTAYY